MEFQPLKGGEKSEVKDKSVLETISSLLSCDQKTLDSCLTSRHIQAGYGKAVLTHLDVAKVERTASKPNTEHRNTETPKPKPKTETETETETELTHTISHHKYNQII